MTKKFLSVFFAIVMVLAMAPVSVFAEDNILDYLTYEIIDGEVTITHCDTSISGDVVIPDTIRGYPVTKLGCESFAWCYYITSVTIPDSITTIDSGAFWECSALESFIVDENNEYYSSDDNGVLFNKDKTELIQYPEANSTTEYIVPDSVTSINGSAFCNCTGLESVIIGDSVTGEISLYECISLKSLTIGRNITSIRDYEFCPNIECITVDEDNEYYSSDENGVLFNKNKTELKYYPVKSSRTEYIIPDSVTSIAYAAFSGCTSLKSVIIPDSITSIDYNAFSGCTGLESIIIPDSVTSVGGYAFSSCTGLSSITIPDSITTIEQATFHNCSGLINVTIGNGVTSIGNGAFSDCTGLESINWNAKNVEDFKSNSYVFYSAGTAGEGIDVVFGEGVEKIPDYCFESSNVKTVTIGNNVDKIGNSAFYKCTGLESVIIGSNVTTIGNSAFYNCKSLENIVLPDNVTTIGNGAFSGCTGLKSAIIGTGINVIKQDTFSNTALEKIVINNKKCFIEYAASTIPASAVIYGHLNSYAETYAQVYSRDFMVLAEVECEHTYGEWIVEVDATCTQRGFEYRLCTLCNGYDFDVIEAAGHIDEDKDNLCDICDEKLSVKIPEINDDNEADDSSVVGISAFLNSIVAFFEKISAWFRAIFGIK